MGVASVLAVGYPGLVKGLEKGGARGNEQFQKPVYTFRLRGLDLTAARSIDAATR